MKPVVYDGLPATVASCSQGERILKASGSHKCGEYVISIGQKQNDRAPHH